MLEFEECCESYVSMGAHLEHPSSIDPTKRNISKRPPTTSLFPSQSFRRFRLSVAGRIVRRFAQSVSRIKRREKETNGERMEKVGERKGVEETARLTGARAPSLSLTSPRNAQTLETIGCE